MTNQYSILFKQEQAHDDAIWSRCLGSNKKNWTVQHPETDLVKVWKSCDEKPGPAVESGGPPAGVVMFWTSTHPAHCCIQFSWCSYSSLGLGKWQTGKVYRCRTCGYLDFGLFSWFSISGHRNSHGKSDIFVLWRVGKGVFFGHKRKFILSIAHSPHKNACSAAIGGISIFDIATGKAFCISLEGHAMPIRSLTFSPDSQLLVPPSRYWLHQIYDVQHANLAGTLSGHASRVLNVTFCAVTHFVSSSSDESVKFGMLEWGLVFTPSLITRIQVWGVNGKWLKNCLLEMTRNSHLSCPI